MSLLPVPWSGPASGRSGEALIGVPVYPQLPCALPPQHSRARDRDRTGDLILTKDVLYRLSYASQTDKRATGLEPATLSLEG